MTPEAIFDQTHRQGCVYVCLCGVNLTCQAEGPRAVDGLVSQLPHVHGDSRDGIWPNSVGHTDLELIGSGWGILLDDQETCSLVQDEVTDGKNKHTETHASLKQHFNAFVRIHTS